MRLARIIAAGVLSTGLAASGGLAAHAAPTTEQASPTIASERSEAKAVAKKTRTIAARTVSKNGGQRFFVLATVKTPARGYRNGATALERSICERKGDAVVANSCGRFNRIAVQRTNDESRVRYRVRGPSDYKTAFVFRVKTPRNEFFKVSYSKRLPVGKK